MKKIFCLICAFIFILPCFNVSASFEDVTSDMDCYEAVTRLSLYGIINGFDGMYNPYDNVTRAEFSKIAAIVGAFDDQVMLNSGNKLFKDVEISHWANGYINTAAKNQILSGYPDGTYRSDNNVTYAEAATIVLRLLGYTTADLGNNWPYAYMNKVNDLQLNKGIEQDINAPINRGKIAMLINNALFTEMKSTAGTSGTTGIKKLYENMKITQSAECIIIATKNENIELMSDDIQTSIGTYKKTDKLVDIPVMSRVKLMLDKDNKIVEILNIYTPRSMTVVVDSVLTDEIVYLYGGEKSSIKIEDNTMVYDKGTKSTYQSQKSKVSQGTELTFYYAENNLIDFMTIKENTWEGPVVAQEDVLKEVSQISGLGFDLQGLTVYRDGYAAKLTDIKKYDVIYYSPAVNTLYVYIDKLSGVYEKALPNKAMVNQVVISGVTKDLETQMAVKKLGESDGSFKIDSKITVLLGKDGKVVDAVDMNTTDGANIGFVMSMRTAVSEDIKTKGRLEYFVTMFMGNGLSMEYKTDKDYSDDKGELRRLEFDGEIARLSGIAKNVIEGTVDKGNRKIGDRWFTQDAKIIELVSNLYGAEPVVKEIKLSDITSSILTKDQVIHAELTDKFGDISALFVKNVTHTKYKYGVLLNASIPQITTTREVKDKEGNPVTNEDGTPQTVTTTSMNFSAKYTISVEGAKNTYSVNKIFSPKKSGLAVGMVFNGNTLEEMTELYEVKTTGKFEAIDFQRIKVGDKSYMTDTNVQIYRLYNDKYEMAATRISLSDVEKYKMTDIKLYADRSPDSGGLVRVITFKE